MTTARELVTFFLVTGGLGIGCGMGIASAFFRRRIERLEDRIHMLRHFPSQIDFDLPIRPVFLPRNRRRF